VTSPRPVHAIVVAYHAARELDRCLAALDNAVEVTVVDNSSSTEVHEVAVRRSGEYLDAGGNLGFGPGVNLALRRLVDGTPQDILLLNPDAALGPRALRVLADFLHEPGNASVAAVSPRLVRPDGGEQRVEWPFPTPGRAWAEAVGLGRPPGGNTFVVGSVLLLRWEALLEVGLFDERFFLYAEEADWQRRATALGWASAVCADAAAEHIGAATSADPRRREALFHAGQETYIRKWGGRSGWWLYRCATLLGAVARALVLVGDRRSEAARRALLYLRGPRRCAALVRD